MPRTLVSKVCSNEGDVWVDSERAGKGGCVVDQDVELIALPVETTVAPNPGRRGRRR